MSGSKDGVLRVGAVSVPMGVAKKWVADYTDPERARGRDPYSFPAYDRFNPGDPGPNTLNDGELLVSVLLNVRPRVYAFYSLDRIRGELESALAAIDPGADLAATNDEEIAKLVAPIYAPLDAPDAKKNLRGVKATTISKIVHRKRPAFLVLHDKWVEKCYFGDGGRLPYLKGRSWAEFMGTLHIAVAADLRDQPDQIGALDAASHFPGELSPVRLLDIIAWTSRGVSHL